jgi:hypothetical protein
VMGRRRDFFFREQSFVWERRFGITNEQFNTFDAQTRHDEDDQTIQVKRVESVSMSLILGWEDVMPSNPSQASDVLPQNIHLDDYDNEGSNCTESCDQNKMSVDSFTYNHSQCAAGKISRDSNMLTVREAFQAANENLILPCDIPTNYDPFEQEPRTEYGRELRDVAVEVRSFRNELSENTIK